MSKGATAATAGDTDWYAQQRARDHTGTTDDINGLTRVRWAEKFYPGQEMVFTPNDNQNFYIGHRNGDDTDWLNSILIAYESSNNVVKTTPVTNWSIASDYTVTNKQISIRYDYGDNKLKLYDLSVAGAETLIGAATTAVGSGAPIYITIGGSQAKLYSPVHRYYGWEYVHVKNGTLSPALQHDNWRINRPTVNANIPVDSVIRHIRGLVPNQKMIWDSGNTFQNGRMGDWKSANAANGISNPHTNDNMWNWGWMMNSNEGWRSLQGMTFNASATHYSAGQPEWRPGLNLNVKVSFRYHSDNSVDIYDEDNSEIIATKTANLDGSIFYLSWATGASITNITDNFFGGGDVTITAV